MAKEDYTTKLDSVLAEAVTDDKEYNKIISSLSTAPTFTDKFKVVQALALKYPTNLSIVDAATQWLKDNSGDLYDSSTSTYLSDGAYRNALLEADTKGKPLNKLFTKINQLRTDNVSNALKETAPDLSKTEFDTSVTELTNGSKTTPYNPAEYIAVASKGTPAVAYKKGMTADQLKTNYGSLIDPTTKKPVFTSQQLEDVANGVASASAFNKKINSLATDAVNKSQDWSLYGGKTGSAYVSAIKNMVSDPSKLATVYKAPDVTDTSVKGGSGIDELITPITTPITTTGAKTGQVPSLKTWHAPQQGVATANSPYSGLLDATLAKVTGANFGTPTNNAVYKNLTDPLTQGMGLDSLPKPKLIYDTANTAGITGLGDVKGTLQSLNTQVTSTPTYNSNQIANANTALENAANIAGKVVDTNTDKTPIKTAAELAAEKFAVDKASYMNSFNARDYIDPLNRTRSDILTQAKTDPKLAANLDWSAQLDQSPADFKSKVGMTPAEIAANKTQSATTPAPFTVNSTTSYNPADYSPELKAALAARAPIDAKNALVGDTITANDNIARGIVSPNVSNTVSTGNMNTYATGPNGEAGIPSALTTAPQFTSGDYIPPANRTLPIFANNPALANQVAWSATQDAAQAKQAAPAVGINTLPNSTGATGTTTPAPFTVNSTTSYNPADYSPELKAALAARAASMGK